MVGENDMFNVRGGVARHVTREAVVTICAFGGLWAPASGCLMTSQAFTAKVSCLFVRCRNEMRIVASAAPQLIAARPLASALREVLHMACHFQFRRRT